jgi:hypothetical protein
MLSPFAYLFGTLEHALLQDPVDYSFKYVCVVVGSEAGNIKGGCVCVGMQGTRVYL